MSTRQDRSNPIDAYETSGTSPTNGAEATKNGNPSAGAGLLTVTDLMKITKESESAWRKRLGRREIPFVKLSANVRVQVSDFEAWLEARTVKKEAQQ